MELRIILNNFQQTKFADITFNEGLTIIKGTNNQGKSSLRRALEAVIFNNPRKTKNYIMNGTKSCSVEIHVEGYKPILWTKTTKECTYTIGDRVHEKAGRLCLKDVYSDHPFTLFDDTLLFNIIKQGAVPIPFGQPSSQVFSIFEELYGILSTKEDINKFNNKLSEFNTQIVQNTRQVDKLKDKLKVIKDFKTHVDLSKLHKIKSKLQGVTTFLSQSARIQEYKDSLESYCKTEIPVDPTDFVKQINLLKEVKKIITLHSNLEDRIKVQPPVNIDDILNTYKKLQEFMVLKDKKDKLEEDLAISKKKISEIREMLPVCPTCGKPL